MAEGVEGRQGSSRYVELTIQRELAQQSLAHLSPEQRKNPELATRVGSLVAGLRHMHSVITEANSRVPAEMRLDGKLDLGNVSEKAHDNTLMDADSIQMIIDTTTSPNLLVDPVTLGLACVDFDQGQWIPGMEATAGLIYQIDAEQRSTFAA